MSSIATSTRAGREQPLGLARERHRRALVTTRHDGRPQVESGGPVATGDVPARSSDDA